MGKKVLVQYVRGGKRENMREPFVTILEKMKLIERVEAEPPKRKRGRPPKVKPDAPPPVSLAVPEGEAEPPRRYRRRDLNAEK